MNGDADDLCYADPGDVAHRLHGLAVPVTASAVTGRALPSLARPFHR